MLYICIQYILWKFTKSPFCVSDSVLMKFQILKQPKCSKLLVFGGDCDQSFSGGRPTVENYLNDKLHSNKTSGLKMQHHKLKEKLLNWIPLGILPCKNSRNKLSSFFKYSFAPRKCRSRQNFRLDGIFLELLLLLSLL